MAPLRRAADLGHAPAQALLGEILDRAEFNEEAVAYFRKAADQGNTDGEFGLGTMLLTGEGVARDPAMAMALFRRAAEKKHPDAIRALAQAHLADGGPGREPAEVLRWARAAAELDHLPSIDALVRAYRQGEYGATPDPKEAARWATRAQELRKVARSRKR
jgi:TPR repeat protein